MKTLVKKLSASLIFAAISGLTWAATLNATVVSTKGKAEVQKGSSWSALSVGSVLSKGDVIQTGFKSELILKIKNTTVTVAPLSRVTIEQLASKSDKDETRLFLDTGSLKSDVKKTEDRRVGFTVRSPVATASVRGTRFGVRNTFLGTIVKGYEGETATWSTAKVQTPHIEQASEETQQVTGNDAQAVSDGLSGAGAVLVRQNMSSSYSGNSSSSNPKNNSEKASGLTGGLYTPTDTTAKHNTKNVPVYVKAYIVD